MRNYHQNKSIYISFHCFSAIFVDYNKVLAYYYSININKEKETALIENIPFYRKLQGLLMKCYKDYQLLPFLIIQRDRLFVFTQIQYDPKSKFHAKMVNSILSFVSQIDQLHNNNNNNSKYTMESIGLVSKVNSIIRETSIFGIIQIVALIDKFPSFTSELFSYLHKNESKGVFGLILLNITNIVLELLKCGVLIDYCNKNRNILDPINNCYFGMVYQINEEILTQSNNILFTRKPISESYILTILSQIKYFAQKNPGHFFWNTNQLLNKYSSFISSDRNNKQTASGHNFKEEHVNIN